MNDVVSAESQASQRSGRSTKYLRSAEVIIQREGLRFIHQRGRFIAALVRPLVWLFIFAAGFRSVLGVSIQPPYATYVEYPVYIAPGLCGMILLFAGMQSSLAMVYDREMGSMRVLLVSPLPRWYLLVCKLMAGVLVAVLQVYVFLVIAWFWEVDPPFIGYLTVLPALLLAGFIARCPRPPAFLDDPTARELRGRDELRHLSDVLCLVRPLSFVEAAREQRPALADLPGQSLHPRCRDDPIRLARPL